MSRKIRQMGSQIDIESLESRRLLVAFGTPWPDARDLTISFPADEVAIGNDQNNLRETFDQIADRAQWQELALRAYQTWAVHADINIGLQHDYDVRFGAPGLMTGDPRFGEFRIGAMPQQGLLANSLPFQAVAGTYSGDLILNSNEDFTYHDWADGQGPDPATIEDGERDLFSLLVHESGNTLGLDDNLEPWSIMFRQYIGPKGVLSQDDIDSIQELYGARSDPYESVSNHEIALASVLPTPIGFDAASDVLSVRGSVASGSDIDVYQFVPVAGQESASVRIRAAGISLLKSRLEILDANGNVLGQSSSLSVYENDHRVELSGLSNDSVLYLRVVADDPNDIYSVGDYKIEIDYRDAAVQAADFPVRSFDSGADALFTDIGLTDDEIGHNDTIADAAVLNAGTSQIANRFETVSSVSNAADVDLWKVTAPSTVNGMLKVQVAGIGLDRPGLRVNLVSDDGSSLGASGRLQPDGTWTMEALHPVADADYYIRVSVDPNSAVAVGNYVVTAEFETPSAQMNDLVSGELDHSVDEFVRWTAGKTKLFRFDLSVSGGHPDEAVQLSIYDAHTQEIRLVLRSDTDSSRSAFALLQQGDYVLRFTALSGQENPTSTIAYALTSDGLSDDQDEDDVDPADSEDYEGYSYEPMDYYEDYSPNYDMYTGYDYYAEYYDGFDYGS